MNAGAQIAIRPLGDSALIVQLNSESLDDIDEVLRVARLLERAAIVGVTEITTAFTTVAVFYDPTRVVVGGNEGLFDCLEAQVRSALAQLSTGEPVRSASDQEVIEIPVCYDHGYALDLTDVAAHASLAPAEVIALHCSAEYRVATVGFTPGFPYLSGLPSQLATPRRASPRAAVPAGSVAIGGRQAGIYAVSSPGGWHVIGRTSMQLFDVTRNPAALLRAGDRVRFRCITAAEFHAAAADSLPERAQATANK
ncbi:MAG: Allophanate hydrolase 2 subunit 1 [uncultured Chthoniobacterales bacterium]|uniref:Allophanate hydrolase 2 subunit 1 n=1 Tax=uncultured Chthoniobacterales bacterium TaxID=1836801 RepID=A0A6J4IVI5_9BACT|nr:MAG: Allophanate hydrolase 2 subunit 1 [uncultured Chthoniobacterales bacterium]